MNTLSQNFAADYPFISPYSVEYVQGGYVVYCLMKPVSSHRSFAEAERAMRQMGCGLQ